MTIKNGKKKPRRETTLGECVVINESTYSPKENWSRVNYLDTGQYHRKRRIDAIYSQSTQKGQNGFLPYPRLRSRRCTYVSATSVLIRQLDMAT